MCSSISTFAVHNYLNLSFTSAWYSFWENLGLEKSESIKETRTEAVAANGGNPLSVARTVKV